MWLVCCHATWMGSWPACLRTIPLSGLAQYARGPVINGLSDYEHPAQALGDMLTILEKRGRLGGLKLAFVGDGNNVANSLLFFAAKMGMDFAIASPRGYELTPEVVELGLSFARQTGAQVILTQDPIVAVRDADVVYTDVWTSMGQEAEQSRSSGRLPAVSDQCRVGATRRTGGVW